MFEECVSFTLSKEMSNRMTLLYFLRSPSSLRNLAWYERRVSSVRCGDLPRLASGMASFALGMVHHKQQWRPAICNEHVQNVSNCVFLVYYKVVFCMSLTTSTGQSIHAAEKLVIAGKKHSDCSTATCKWITMSSH